MGFRYLEKDIDDIVKSKPMAIEKALKILRIKIDLYNDKLRNENNLYQEFKADQAQEVYKPEDSQEDAVDKLIQQKKDNHKANSEKQIKAKRAARSE